MLRPESINPLEENIASTLFGMDFSNVFLDMSLQIRETKVKNEQMGLHHTEKFSTETKQNKILAKQIDSLPKERGHLQIRFPNFIQLNTSSFFGNCNFGWSVPRENSIISNSEENILFGDILNTPE